MSGTDVNHTVVCLFLCVRRDHPHIVHLVDYFWEPDRGYIVMEMCEGGDLLDRIIAKVLTSIVGQFQYSPTLLKCRPFAKLPARAALTMPAGEWADNCC